MYRLFVGLELTPAQQSALVHVRGGVEGAHWQCDEQLHLTLAFIGEASPSQMRSIEGALAGVDFMPFDMTLLDVGMFGMFDMPRTLWAGVADKDPIIHLHDKILNAVERTGLAVDRRRYKPHVTLARFNRGVYARIGSWLAENSTLKSHTETVQHFTLFSSHRTKDGPIYTVEARFGLPSFEYAEEEFSEAYSAASPP
ncbi:MAG: RNA 2',3'-cyclic phosphodiesterase [Kordiimonadaceae bacterium]|nr:RNA 2',3'-cyclic phosphodiesterase [Kordiimonadaceae bacterium]